MHDCQRDSHATSPTAIYANITQTGRIRVYCRWFWVVLAGFVGVCSWFWVVLAGFVGGCAWFACKQQRFESHHPTLNSPTPLAPNKIRRPKVIIVEFRGFSNG